MVLWLGDLMLIEVGRKGFEHDIYQGKLFIKAKEDTSQK
jgi:hypothetical protein